MKRKLLFAALCVVSALGLRAQTDVTSQYITNADFSQTTALTSTYLYGYDKDGSPCNFQSVDGWTSVVTATNTSGTSKGGYAGGVFAYGSSTHLKGNDMGAPSADPDNQSGNCLGFFSVWGAGGYYYQEVTLQPGAYTINIPVYNQSGTSATTTYFGWAPDEGTASTMATPTSTGSWQTLTTSFTLESATKGQIRIGYKSNGSGSGANPHLFIDKVQILCSPFATASDYTALNSAISTAEDITWGFDAGEYAPYNYAEVIRALAEAKAINQEANNSQATVQALTATLNTTMTANAAEVNAIWDPSFEHEYSTTGNVQPIAWTGTSGHNNATDVRWMWNVSSNAGLAATSSSKALFTKYGVHYGQQAGYTLPLNASTYYTLSFKYGGWSDCKKDGYVTMTNPSSASVSLIPSADLPLDAVDGNSNKDSWKNYQAFFKTNDAGNYVLGLRKKDESKQSQYVYGDIVLKATTIAEATAYYNAVKDEVDDSYNAEANGASEKTAFKTALDASIPATVAEIMEAAANLYTLRDAFVAATPKYDQFVAEKTSAIAIGVTTEAANAVTMTTADGLDDALHALYVLEDAAATSGYAVDATTLFGSWTAQNLETKDNEHWSGSTVTYYDKWNNSGFTSSINSTVKLPAGKYVFKLAARAQTGGVNGAFNMSVKVGDADAVSKDFVAKGNSGKGIDTSGAVNYGEGTFANDNNGRGWEWRFIGFELDAEASVTMTGYAQIYANNWVGFTDATLLTTSENVAVLKNLLKDEITAANAIYASGANVGTGVFQHSSESASTFNTAINTTAQGVYDNASATSSDVSDAIDALKAAEETYITSINPPAADTRYYLTVATSGHAKKDNAIVVSLGATGDNNKTGYGFAAAASPVAYMAQAFIFTQVSGNTYKISVERPEGMVYLTYGSLNNSAAGWATQQIQGTTDFEKAGEFKIVATTTANVFNIVNTVFGGADNYVDCQDGGSLYTDTNIDMKDFTLTEASKASVDVNIAAGKYATRIFPFTPSAIDGITFYSCASVDASTLTLSPVDEGDLAANTPYILQASKDVNVTLEGWGTAAADSYTDGLLTGVYTTADVPAGSYVLQTQNGNQGFFRVNEAAPAVPYRAYLTIGSGGAVKVYNFGDTDKIDAVAAENAENAAIYNLAGQRVQKAVKGIYIVSGKKVILK